MSCQVTLAYLQESCQVVLARIPFSLRLPLVIFHLLTPTLLPYKTPLSLVLLELSPVSLPTCCHCSVGKSCPTFWDPMDCTMLVSPVLLSLLELAQIHVHWVVMLSIHCSLSHSILLLLPSVLPSIRHFTIESALCITWPKYWSFSISPSNEYSGLISFRVVWFDILAVLGTLKSLLQHLNFNFSSYGSQPSLGFPDSWVGKESACNAGGSGSIPGWEDLLEKG